MAGGGVATKVAGKERSEKTSPVSANAVVFGVDVRSKVVVGDLVIVSIMWVRGVKPSGAGEA